MGTTFVSAQTACKSYPFGFVSFAAVDAALSNDAARIACEGGVWEAASRPLTSLQIEEKFRRISGLDDPDEVRHAVMRGARTASLAACCRG